MENNQHPPVKWPKCKCRSRAQHLYLTDIAKFDREVKQGRIKIKSAKFLTVREITDKAVIAMARYMTGGSK